MSSDLSPEDKEWERTFALFKLEYEQAAQRFENIYGAIWQIFQYMALLSAGILTFGSKTSMFSSEVVIFFALSPLAFWFLATYIPMDHYGQNTRKHLQTIESQINGKFGSYWQLYSKPKSIV